MKHIYFKTGRNLLIAVSVFCLPLLTVKAQTATNLIPADQRWTSAVELDNMGNATDSAVFIWTQKGMPVAKEDYMTDDAGKWQLGATGKIISDNGNTVEYQSTQISEDGDIVMLVDANFNDFGEPLRMVATTDVMGTPMTMFEMTFQYWRGSNNRLDSSLVNTNIIGITTSSKMKYTAYDADGLPTVVETYTESNLGGDPQYSKDTYTYTKGAGGKLERQVMSTYNQNPLNGELYLNEETVTLFDAKGRPVRSDTYSGASDESNLKSSEVYHYNGETGIVNPDLISQQVVVRIADGWLSVNSPKAEKITIYSSSGRQVYVNSKPLGEVEIAIDNLPKGVYIVAGSSGWVKKIEK